MEETEQAGGEQNTFQEDMEMNEEDFKKLQKIDNDVDANDFKDLGQKFEKAINRTKPTDDDLKTKRKFNLAHGVNYNLKCELCYLWCRRGLTEWEEELQV